MCVHVRNVAMCIYVCVCVPLRVLCCFMMVKSGRLQATHSFAKTHPPNSEFVPIHGSFAKQSMVCELSFMTSETILEGPVLLALGSSRMVALWPFWCFASLNLSESQTLRGSRMARVDGTRPVWNPCHIWDLVSSIQLYNFTYLLWCAVNSYLNCDWTLYCNYTVYKRK